jgi:hypothetical protein
MHALIIDRKALKGMWVIVIYSAMPAMVSVV